MTVRFHFVCSFSSTSRRKIKKKTTARPRRTHTEAQSIMLNGEQKTMNLRKDLWSRPPGIYDANALLFALCRLYDIYIYIYLRANAGKIQSPYLVVLTIFTHKREVIHSYARCIAIGMRLIKQCAIWLIWLIPLNDVVIDVSLLLSLECS